MHCTDVFVDSNYCVQYGKEARVFLAGFIYNTLNHNRQNCKTRRNKEYCRLQKILTNFHLVLQQLPGIHLNNIVTSMLSYYVSKCCLSKSWRTTQQCHLDKNEIINIITWTLLHTTYHAGSINKIVFFITLRDLSSTHTSI